MESILGKFCLTVQWKWPTINNLGKSEINMKTKIVLTTLLIAEILSGKNARAWVSMDFT